MAQTKGSTRTRSSGGTVDTSKSDDSKSEWSVVNTDGRRTLFRGTEDDARQYVQDHFPHVHVEPGTDYGDDGPQPDVFVKDPKGNLSGLVGKDWVDYQDE